MVSSETKTKRGKKETTMRDKTIIYERYQQQLVATILWSQNLQQSLVSTQIYM